MKQSRINKRIYYQKLDNYRGRKPFCFIDRLVFNRYCRKVKMRAASVRDNVAEVFVVDGGIMGTYAAPHFKDCQHGNHHFWTAISNKPNFTFPFS